MVGTTLIEGGAVTTDRIAANAVTAEKITVDQALVNKLAVSSLWAGKINAQMLSATAIDGKTITSATVKSATISGGTITGGTITGATFKTAASGRRLQIDTGGLRFYDSNNNQTAQLDENGLSLTYTTPEGEVQSVGHFFDNSIVGHPEYRGLSIGLDYEQGWYWFFGYRASKTATTYTPAVTIDPWGYYNGAAGCTGTKFQLPICIGSDPADGFWQRLKFKLVYHNGWGYPALTSISGRAGIMFGTDQLYILEQNHIYPMRDILKGASWNV